MIPYVFNSEFSRKKIQNPVDGANASHPFYVVVEVIVGNNSVSASNYICALWDNQNASQIFIDFVSNIVGLLIKRSCDVVKRCVVVKGV